MRTIGLTALVAFGLVTPAMAAATVPEEYQGVWAAARDCKENFQNVLSNVVNREFAAMTAISLAVGCRGRHQKQSNNSTNDGRTGRGGHEEGSRCCERLPTGYVNIPA